MNIQNHIDGFCDIPNSNTYTRKCEHVFPSGHKLIDQNNQGLLLVSVNQNWKLFGHSFSFTLQIFELSNKNKEIASWENLDPKICQSLGCCSLKNALGINECTIISRHQGAIKTLGPNQYRLVSKEFTHAVPGINLNLNF